VVRKEYLSRLMYLIASTKCWQLKHIVAATQLSETYSGQLSYVAATHDLAALTKRVVYTSNSFSCVKTATTTMFNIGAVSISDLECSNGQISNQNITSANKDYNYFIA